MIFSIISLINLISCLKNLNIEIVKTVPTSSSLPYLDLYIRRLL